MAKSKYKVRFYLKSPYVECPRQIEYKSNSLFTALKNGIAYTRNQAVITSYTVTDRVTGEKTNIKLG